MCLRGGRESAELVLGGRWFHCTVDPLLGPDGKISGAVHVLREISAEVSRRSQVADGLERERQLLRTLIDLLPDFIFVKDTQSRFLVANKALARAYGRQPAELLSRTDADFLSPSIATHCLAAEQQVLAGQSVSAWEDTICFPDGWTRTVVTNMAAFRDAQGTVRGLVGIGRDLSRRKRMEVTLRDSEEKFHQLFATVPDAVFVFDAETRRFVEANDAALRMYGYSREELRSVTAMDLTAESEASDKTIRQVVAAESTQVPVRYHRKKDGTIFPVEISASAFLLRGRKLYCGIVRDVTNHRQAEAALRASESALRRANRTLQAIRDCHEAMLRAGTERELLDEICRIIVQSSGERMAWVGFAEANPRKTVRPVASAGVSSDHLRTVRVTWANVPRGRGPVGMAIRTGRACLCRDTQTDPNFAPWRGSARRHGYGSVLALPLLVDQRCFGALAIYAPEPDGFDADEQLMFNDLANDLAFGINTLRLRAEREQLENEILKSTEREQERIGRDLHDGLCQLLVGARFRSVYLQKISGDRTPVVKREAKALEVILNHAIEQTRNLARGLNPVHVTPAGLVAALQQLADDVESAHRVHCFARFPKPRG